jgi:DNA-binding MarR family transcriptional regulator
MWEECSFIISSSYRKKVLDSLKEGPKTVHELSWTLGIKPPNISKTLRELEAKGLIEGLTSRGKKGRLYAMTQKGKRVWLSVPRAVGLLLEEKIMQELNDAHIQYTRNATLRGLASEARPDFVIPSDSAPKVVVEVKFIKPPYPRHALKEAAFEAADLKRAMKDLKFVLVIGGASKTDLPEIPKITCPEYFDKVFFEEDLEELPGYIQEIVGPSSEK